jgi:hypothetical protein
VSYARPLSKLVYASSWPAFRFTHQIRTLQAYFKPDWAILGEALLIGFPSFVKGISADQVGIGTNNLLRLIGGDSALGVFAIVNRLYAARTRRNWASCRGCSRSWGITSAGSAWAGCGRPSPMRSPRRPYTGCWSTACAC